MIFGLNKTKNTNTTISNQLMHSPS